jgi:AraC-like DNA-binding protein
MAWLQADDEFDADSISRPVIGIAAELRNHDSGIHQHRMGQLLFAASGCVRITLARRLCILPPTRIAWIPPHTPHRAEMKDIVGYRSVWFDPRLIGSLPEDVAVLDTNPLLSAVLERIALADFAIDWQSGANANLLAVCLDELRVAGREPVFLRLPVDRRLRNFTGDALPPPLNELAASAGASQKTVSRIFIQQTGMSYQHWRQQWRFLKSVELLATGNSLSFTAAELGFASDSAFIAFFKKLSGTTPRAYIPTRP